VDRFDLYLAGLGWLLLTLGPLLLFQRWLHQEIQLVLLLITRRHAATLVLFSLLFFPGVLLHEASHFIAARLLLVRTGEFSLIPAVMPGGKLRLGYVDTERSDSLIGAAPLVTGGAVVAYLGIWQLGLTPLSVLMIQGNWPAFWRGLTALPSQPDFWLWFYFAFTISSTMLPSASDRRAWLPVVLVVVALAGLALLAGAGPWMLDHLAPWLNRGLQSLATVFGISLVLHLVILLPFRLLRELILRLTGERLQRA
jgi:hypothetical protein